MLTTHISLYNGVKDTTGSTVTVSEALAIIKSDTLSNQIHAITHQPDAKKRADLKSKLPAVTWSGSFAKRKASELQSYSALICLDFDHLKEAQITEFKTDIAPSITFILAAFTSPSGNGLKVVCRVATGPAEHAENFRALADFFKDNFDLEADESGKDVSRLCFLSWDISWYINAQCRPFVLTPQTTNHKQKTYKQTSSVVETSSPFENIRTFTDKKFTYADGSRNQYINAFVMNCKHRGINDAEVKNYCANAFHDYVAEHDIKHLSGIINSVYSNPGIVFGQYAPRAHYRTSANGQTAKNGKPSPYNDTILFYYEIEKDEKNADGSPKIEHKFDHDGLTWFMANNGFRKLKLGDKGFQYIRATGNLLEAIEPEEMNAFVLDYLQQHVTTGEGGIYGHENVNDELREVRRMYKRGINNYSKPTVYASLPPIKPDFLTDTKKTTYLYFKNGYVEITAENILLKDYNTLNRHLWHKHRKDFEITLLPNAEVDKGDTFIFLKRALLGSEEQQAADPEAMQKLLSLLTTLGYLVNTHKDPTRTKAVVFCDKEINRTGRERHGGSGKSMVGNQMLSKIVNRYLVDGQDFRFDSPYPFESLKADHKLIVFNDVDRKFPFVKLFHKITEDFEFRKKYVDAIILPFEDSPKMLITTNHAIEGEGSSYRRRQQFIEFCNYYSDEYTIVDDFKHSFFEDWDTMEWNRFYNTFFMAVQQFHKHGLVPFPAANIELNKLIQMAQESFVDWMDAMYIGDTKETSIYPLGEKMDRAKIFEAFKQDCPEYATMKSSNSFTAWVKMWCKVRGYELNKHKNGAIDKSGKTYFWTVTKREGKNG